MSSLLCTVSTKVCSPWEPASARTEVAELSRGSHAWAGGSASTAREPWARVGDPRGGLKANKTLTLRICQLSSGSPTVSCSADSAEQGPHGRGQGTPQSGKEYPQYRQYLPVLASSQLHT